MNDKITIVTHNGKFHADDVFAVATLQLVLPGSEFSVIRTRNEEWFAKGDYIVDIGGVYDEGRDKFDHHQIGGAGERENGIPYASFGLVWKKFGEEICGSEEISSHIDKKLVQSIDAADNGMDVSKPLFEKVYPYTVGSVINSYRPTWKEKNKDINEQFLKAVAWAKTILEREIEMMRHGSEAEQTIDEYYKQSEDKRLIIFHDENHSFGRELVVGNLLQQPEPLYAVFYRGDAGNWQVVAINKTADTFETRKPLPESWRGLSGEEFAEVSGVRDAVFCHRNGFMCVVKSKEGALQLAELALNN